jgi:hypothetical protein
VWIGAGRGLEPLCLATLAPQTNFECITGYRTSLKWLWCCFELVDRLASTVTVIFVCDQRQESGIHAVDRIVLCEKQCCLESDSRKQTREHSTGRGSRPEKSEHYTREKLRNTCVSEE